MAKPRVATTSEVWRYWSEDLDRLIKLPPTSERFYETLEEALNASAYLLQVAPWYMDGQIRCNMINRFPHLDDIERRLCEEDDIQITDHLNRLTLLYLSYIEVFWEEGVEALREANKVEIMEPGMWLKKQMEYERNNIEQ